MDRDRRESQGGAGQRVLSLGELRARHPDASDDFLKALQRDPSLEKLGVHSMDGLRWLGRSDDGRDLMERGG